MSIQLARPNWGSSLCPIELQPQLNISYLPSASISTSEPHRQEVLSANEEPLQESVSVNPGNTVGQLQRWNNPRSNIARTFTTFLSFAIMGATDAAYGVCLLAQMLSSQLECYI